MNDDTDIVRKVIDLDSARVFEGHGALVHSKPLRGVQVTAINPVPVLGSSGRIGFATVDTNDENLDTKIFLTAECPERLDLDNGEPFFIAIEDASSILKSEEGQIPILVSFEVKAVRLRSAKGGTNIPLITTGQL